jgi:rubrerythrin
MDYSKTPVDLSKVKPEDVDKEMLRAAIWVELDTVNLYEQFMAVTNDDATVRVLRDVTTEEKKHTAQFMQMLLHLDPEQVKEFQKARDEVKKLTGLDIPEV